MGKEQKCYRILKTELQDPVEIGFVSGFVSLLSGAAQRENIRIRQGLDRLGVHYAVTGDTDYRSYFVSRADVQTVEDSGLVTVVNLQAER